MKTNMHLLTALVLTAGCAGAAPNETLEKEPAPAPASAVRSGYADINGLHYYYEVEGTGDPILLLHGGLGTGSVFAPARSALAATHQVIAVDLQGHGRTGLG